MCHGLSCQQGSSHWLNVAVKWIQFFPPVSHNKCTRVMIGVWAGFTQRTWLFISNGQQFAHLSARRAQYAPILPSFYPSLPAITPPSITPSLHLHLLFSVILHFFLPYTFPSLPPSTSSFPVSRQMVPSVLIEAIAQSHHAKCLWLQLNASLWANSKSQGTGQRIHPPWQ